LDKTFLTGGIASSRGVTFAAVYQQLATACRNFGALHKNHL
jgi:hypothetical protein